MFAGKYIIEQVLGSGGMATVYAARHRNGNPVALKVLHRELARSPEASARFLREGYIANSVVHDGVVRVLDDGVLQDGTTYLVMDLVVGATVGTHLARSKRLPMDEALAIAGEVLRVLGAAHAKRIVHRDIKPDNLFVTREGELRVLDFGIARNAMLDGSNTLPGTVVGTPAFMAPEQALGVPARITEAADIWAVGATVFTLLTGEFVNSVSAQDDGVEHAATRRARALEAALAFAPPPLLLSLIDRALELEPADRWRDAPTMLAAVLETRAQIGKGSPAPVRDVLLAMARAHDADAQMRAPEPDLSSVARADTLALNEPSPSRARPAGYDHPTRTSSAVIGSLPREQARVHEPVRRKWMSARAMLACVGVLATASLVAAVIVGRRRTENASTTSASTPPAAAVAVAEEGLQLLREGSRFSAITKLDEATRIDPSFAQAHLYYVAATSFIDASVREHFEAAVRNRLKLSSSDQRLLAAVEPLVAQPPREGDAAAALRALALESPDSWLLNVFWLHHLIESSPQSDRLAIAERMIATDPNGAWGWDEKAEALVDLERVDEARDAFRHCLERAPHSRGCLRSWAAIENNSGNCALARTLSQQLIAAAPGSSLGYRVLADALAGESAPKASISFALEKRGCEGSTESEVR